MRTPRTDSGVDRRVSTAVVTAVAEAEGCSPTDLAPPLHAVVDPDALDRLFVDDHGRAGSEPSVSFTYYGYNVRVAGPDDVVVRPADGSDPTGSRTESRSPEDLSELDHDK